MDTTRPAAALPSASSFSPAATPPGATSAAEEVAPHVDRATRVVVDADTTLIMADDGDRVINAIAANSAALDACLTDMLKLLERGTLPSMSIEVDTNGKLSELTLQLPSGVTDPGDGGVRTTLYSNDQAQRDAKDSVSISGVLKTDDSLPITCLAPGKSVRIEQKKSIADVIIAPGGRRYSDTFLVAGGCDIAESRVMLGGARLDWTKATSKPTVVVLPAWAHHLDPFEPRKVWR